MAISRWIGNHPVSIKVIGEYDRVEQVASGGFVDADMSDPHNKGYAESGLLIAVPDNKKAVNESAKTGN